MVAELTEKFEEYILKVNQKFEEHEKKFQDIVDKFSSYEESNFLNRLTILERNATSQPQKSQTKEILNIVAIQNVEKLENAKAYRQWNNNFKNAFSQSRPKSRLVLEFLETITTKDVQEEMELSDNETKLQHIKDIYT